jgi:hypothetical protein
VFHFLNGATINPVAILQALIGPVVNDTSIMMGGKSDYCPASVVSLCEGTAIGFDWDLH